MNSRTRSLLFCLAIALAPAIGCGLLEDVSPPPSDGGAATSDGGGAGSAGASERSSSSGRGSSARLTTADEFAELFRTKTSGVMVEFEGSVDRLLRDDLEGSRHQKFIVRIGDRTLLIAHNIDLAERVPVDRGDRVRIRGQYEWNDRGGVVHWTHHDPKGYREGGWIEADGERYR